MWYDFEFPLYFNDLIILKSLLYLYKYAQNLGPKVWLDSNETNLLDFWFNYNSIYNVKILLTWKNMIFLIFCQFLYYYAVLHELSIQLFFWFILHFLHSVRKVFQHHGNHVLVKQDNLHILISLYWERNPFYGFSLNYSPLFSIQN